MLLALALLCLCEASVAVRRSPGSHGRAPPWRVGEFAAESAGRSAAGTGASPWWDHRAAGAEERGRLRRRARRVLERHLGLQAGLLDVLMAYLPLRFHVVAAKTESSALVWEVAVSPGGIMAGHAVLHHDIRLPPVTRFFSFLPRNEVLVAASGAYLETVFYDVWTGAKVVVITRSQVVAVSPSGDTVVGTGATTNPFVDAGMRMWETNTGGQVLPRTPAPTAPLAQGGRVPSRTNASSTRFPTFCRRAAFSPSGDKVAALFSRIEDSEVWGVAIWSGSAEPLCGCDIPREHYPLLLEIETLAFDGEALVFCRGTHYPALYFRVGEGAGDGGCEVVMDIESRAACNDIHFPTGLRLSVDPGAGTAKVDNLRDGWVLSEGSVGTSWEPALAFANFSPDGQKALLTYWSLGGISKSFIWHFSAGSPPRLVDAGARSLAFSDDSDALVGIAEGGLDVVWLDFEGRTIMSFRPPVDMEITEVIARSCAG